MDRLQRLRFVTERYEQLQGLRIVPLGIPFLFSSAWRDGRLTWVPWIAGTGSRVWFVALLLVAVGLSGVAKIYYHRRFGCVQPGASIRSPLAVSVFAAFLIIAASMQGALQTAVSFPAVILAFGLGFLALAGGLVRPHYLAVAIAAGALALSGALGVPFHIRDVLLDRMIGIGFLVVGIGDHLLLRSTLVPVPHADSAVIPRRFPW